MQKDNEMSEEQDDKIRIPPNKRGKVVLIKSRLSSYNQDLWVVVESENVIGLDPGSIVPKNDLLNLHAIPDIDVILKDISALEKIDLKT